MSGIRVEDRKNWSSQIQVFPKSLKVLHTTSVVVHPDCDVTVHTSGGRLKVHKHRGVLLFLMTVSGSFAPAASTPAITVIPSFSSFSIQQHTDSVSVVAQVQNSGHTDSQFVSAILMMFSGGYSSIGFLAREINAF
jgi:hypothetical protein